MKRFKETYEVDTAFIIISSFVVLGLKDFITDRLDFFDLIVNLGISLLFNFFVFFI
jgi:hypothetical protein